MKPSIQVGMGATAPLIVLALPVKTIVQQPPGAYGANSASTRCNGGTK